MFNPRHLPGRFEEKAVIGIKAAVIALLNHSSA
jgi:hypothetical protein